VCVCVNGSRNGRDDAVGGASLDHGVETSSAELSVGVGKSLGGGEQVGELLQRDSRAVGVCGAVVEAIVGSGSDGREGDELAEDLHLDCVWVVVMLFRLMFLASVTFRINAVSRDEMKKLSTRGKTEPR